MEERQANTQYVRKQNPVRKKNHNAEKSDKEYIRRQQLISKIHKELIQLNSKKQTKQNQSNVKKKKKGKRNSINIFPKTHKCPQVQRKVLNITNHQENANQNQNEISHGYSSMAIIKKKKKKTRDKGW